MIGTSPLITTEPLLQGDLKGHACPFTNTHFYDSCIKQVYKECVECDMVTTPSGVNRETPSWESFSALLGEASAEIIGDSLMSCSARRALELFQRDPSQNVDGNGLNVQEIFPRVWQRVRELGLQNAPYVLEQLADIVDSGPCSNGRINRLVQLYKATFE